MTFTLRTAQAADLPAMLDLLPRLGDFDVIPGRDSRDLWQHDAELLRQHLDGQAPQCFAQVAEQDQRVVGLTLVSMQPHYMDHELSGHLEAIAVSSTAEGTGIGRALLDAAESEAAARGAKNMTLHVYHTNHRAAGIYQRRGYHGELIRNTKPLSKPNSS